MKRGTGTERNENSRHATLCCCDVAREPYRESAMAIYLFAKRIQFAHQDIFHAAFVSRAYVYMYACVYACALPTLVYIRKRNCIGNFSFYVAAVKVPR